MKNSTLVRRPTVRDIVHLSLGKPAEPLSWRALSAVGRIVLTPDDRPIRGIVTGRRRMTTGFYPSTKSGRIQHYEGMNEQALLMHCEVDTEVVDYRAQPFRFEFVLDGINRIYIADCARLLANGKIEVVEAKSDRRALKDPDYAAKLTCVRDICSRLGWTFRVALAEELFKPRWAYEDVVEIQSRRQVRFDQSHSFLALDLIARQSGSIPLGKLAEALAERRIGTAITMAMMVARLVKIDRTSPLSADSEVGLVRCASPAVVGGMS